MSTSLYGAGGYGVVATTDTTAAPKVAYWALGSAAITADGKSFNAMVISHTGTTDGSTANTTDWLHYRVTDDQGRITLGILLPGKERAVKVGFNDARIQKVELWGTL